MAEGFTKLFGSILASTVWQEPHATRLTWITMLAMSDKDGIVSSSVPGLAHFARVSVQECEAALATFLSPDPYSRTPDHDGRRVEKVAGGWRLLNHGVYRDRRDDAATRERKRQWDRENRPSGHARMAQSDDGPTQSDEVRPNPTHTDTDADADTKSKALVQQAARDDAMPDGVPARITRPMPPDGVERRAGVRFPEFWAVYPVKKGRAEALKKWKLKRLDANADAIIAHVRRMEREDDDWLRGFIPHGSTYINGERWEDEPKKDKPATAPAPAPETFGAKAALVRSETKLENAIAYIRQRHARGELGEGAPGQAEMRRLINEATDKHREEKCRA